jgi:hypothetical protein
METFKALETNKTDIHDVESLLQHLAYHEVKIQQRLALLKTKSLEDTTTLWKTIKEANNNRAEEEQPNIDGLMSAQLRYTKNISISPSDLIKDIEYAHENYARIHQNQKHPRENLEDRKRRSRIRANNRK